MFVYSKLAFIKFSVTRRQT